MISLTNILKTCDGRDKLCALIQYTSKFYSTLLYQIVDLEYTHSIDMDPFRRYIALKNVEKSMSNGRKIFRFLKWIEDIREIYYYIIFKNTSIRNILKALMAISSMFYHIFDNLVWSANVGVISEFFVGEIKLKNTKNIFSFLRNIIKIFMDIYKFQNLFEINSKNEEEVYEAFENKVENFQTENHKKLLIQTIEIRSKMRNKLLDIIHSFLRCIMLIYSLKFEPIYSNVHPIFNGLCGMVQSIISLYKIFYDLETQKAFGSTLANMNNIAKHGSKKKKKNLEDIIDELDEACENTILDENYFENYYVDFNKDFPTNREDILNRI